MKIIYIHSGEADVWMCVCSESLAYTESYKEKENK